MKYLVFAIKEHCKGKNGKIKKIRQKNNEKEKKLLCYHFLFVLLHADGIKKKLVY